MCSDHGFPHFGVVVFLDGMLVRAHSLIEDKSRDSSQPTQWSQRDECAICRNDQNGSESKWATKVFTREGGSKSVQRGGGEAGRSRIKYDKIRERETNSNMSIQCWRGKKEIHSFETKTSQRRQHANHNTTNKSYDTNHPVASFFKLSSLPLNTSESPPYL